MPPPISARGCSAGREPNGFQLENGSAKELADDGALGRRPNNESKRFCAEADVAGSTSATRAMPVRTTALPAMDLTRSNLARADMAAPPTRTQHPQRAL